jgi:urease accessory protein
MAKLPAVADVSRPQERPALAATVPEVLDTAEARNPREAPSPPEMAPPVGVQNSASTDAPQPDRQPGPEMREWRGRLSLKFEPQTPDPSRTEVSRTVLAEQKHVGPLLVQRPFYPERDGTCHVYLLHPPGGVVGGDRLRIEARVAAGARALLTTPAAGKFYRSAGAEAEQVHAFHVARGGCLEWFPQETIVYTAARARLRTEVHLEAGAHFLGWDVLCLGRPASGERFDRGSCHAALELWRDGHRLLSERARYDGGGEILGAGWGLAGYPVSATFVAAGGDAKLAERVREVLDSANGDGRFAVTALDGVLVARCLGEQAEAAKRRLTQVWSVAREALLGKAAAIPRIWYT